MPRKTTTTKKDLLGLGKIIETVARIIPQTVDKIGGIVKITSDNKLKLKLEVIKNNLEILNIKVVLAQNSLENNLEISEELIKDVFSTCDLLVRINYNIIEIIGSETKEENSKKSNKRLDELISYMKENPEIIMAPIFPYVPLAVALYKKINKN